MAGDGVKHLLDIMDIEIEDKSLLRTRQIAWSAIAIGATGMLVLLIHTAFHLSVTGTRSALDALQGSPLASQAERVREVVRPQANGSPPAATASALRDRTELAASTPRPEPGAIPPSGPGMLQDEGSSPATRIIPEFPEEFDRLLAEMLQARPAEFRPASSFLTWKGKSSLDQLLPFLKAKPDWRFEIGAHVAPGENAEADRSLSERRAEAVAGYLGSEGVSNTRMTVRGYGASRPIADNDTEAGRLRNQRIEIRVIVAR